MVDNPSVGKDDSFLASVTDKRKQEEKTNKDKGKGKGLGHLFDKPEEIDPNSEFEILLDSFVIERGDGKKHKAKGINRKLDYGDSHDHHKTRGEAGIGMKRNFLSDSSLYWPNKHIPYEIGSEYYRRCTADQFKCLTSRRCIPYAWRCDMYLDCGQGDLSDELNCENVTRSCDNGEFQCASGNCILETWKCDNVIDCYDGSDEIGCVYPNECLRNNGGCEQRCVQLDAKHSRCECRDGYKINPDNPYKCINIDECQLDVISPCSQICTDLEGSYSCSCFDGYRIATNTRNTPTCLVEGPRPRLLMTDRSKIQLLDVDTWSSTTLLNNTWGAAFLAVYKDKYLYWNEVNVVQETKTIYRAAIQNESLGLKEAIITNDISSMGAIAVEWIHNLLYWVDEGQKNVQVSALDGSKRTVVVDEDLGRPRGLALDPIRRYMYVTDWGNIAKIQRIGLDGSDKQNISTDHEVGYPNSIAIDFLFERVYWTDAKLKCIVSTDLDGSRPFRLYSSDIHVGHAFGLAVFEDNVYWTDWVSSSVRRADKASGLHVETVFNSTRYRMPMEIQILHRALQPEGDNVCGNNNGGCEHLCLPSPGNETLFTCSCPTDYILVGTECVSKTA